MATRFRHIARAVIVKDHKILICRMKGSHSFLPGGGVELGEGAKSAVRRELREELGIGSCHVGRFLGVIETLIEETPNATYLHEINHLFEVQVDSLEPPRNPESMESHLEFYWTEFNQQGLAFHNVLPQPIPQMLPLFYEGKVQWFSSFEEQS